MTGVSAGVGRWAVERVGLRLASCGGVGRLGASQLDEVARALAPHGPPVVVFNASHSGSRLLAKVLRELGVFMGGNLNDSEDSLDVFDFVRYLVETHAPDFSRLFEAGDTALSEHAFATFSAHLTGRGPDQPWGWKLCETGHVLPVIARIFPGARFVHLIRDGRDVAFSPFLAPKSLFWRKIYFGTDRIRSWHGLDMTQRAYREHGHRFNAARWVNSVTLGRAHGAMLGERYLEVRYEDLVADLPASARRVAGFLNLDADLDAPLTMPVFEGGVGKWRRRSARELREIRPILEPTLASFGYHWPETVEPAIGLTRWLRAASI
ncbi:MAG: sulfotransferase family protein [Caulobacterales bacterium]